jgi:hypothetical protein
LAPHDTIPDDILTRAVRPLEIGSFEGQSSTHDRKQNYTKTPNIERRTSVGSASKNLRCQIRNGPAARFHHGARLVEVAQAEISDLGCGDVVFTSEGRVQQLSVPDTIDVNARTASLLCEQDVFQLEIAVANVLVVGVANTPKNLGK